MKLKDLGTIFTGNTPKKSDKLNYNSNDICFVKPSDISEKEITHINHTEYYIANHAYNSARLAPKNSILVTCIGIIGKIAILEKECAFNQQINAIIPNEKKIIPYYLAYALKYKKKSMQDKANAPVVPIINKTEFSEINIKVPSLEKQKKIVNILIKIDKIINWRFQQLNKLNQLVSSLFIEMFNDPIKNNMNWEVKKLKDLCLKIGSGATPKGGQSVYIDKGTSFIRSMNVYNGYFKYNGLAHINENHAQQLENVSLKENDILLNITGASVARSCIVPKNLLPARVNQHVALIRVNKEKINPIFLNHVFITDSFQKYLLNISASNGATRQAITKQQIEELNIIVPSSKLVDLYVKKVQQIDKSKYASDYVKLIFIQNKILNIFFS